MKVEYVTFKQRADRSQYIANRFGQYLQSSLLDVGCDMALLKDLLSPEVYTGIDMGGKPDMKLDLEAIDRLPFDDNQFHSCVCSDVLEHLDTIHFMFGELVRVTEKYLLISLPNNWANARRPVERGKGRIAHYGLPAEKPVDRHKWFFGFTEADEFLEAQAEKYNLKIIDKIANDKPRFAPVRMARQVVYPGNKYLNRYAHTLWVVFEKK
jgi:hypothetical protein